jgi:hypothetical protein
MMRLFSTLPVGSPLCTGMGDRNGAENAAKAIGVKKQRRFNLNRRCVNYESLKIRSRI